MSEVVPLMIEVVINGQRGRYPVERGQHLVDFLRDQRGLKGPHLGCEHGVCGACTVRVDGQIVRGCLMLAVQAEGKRVDTIEGLTERGEVADLQQAFLEHNAMQCGFCTSGMLLTASELLDHCPLATRDEVRQWISGNYCRCTGYHAIVDAICAVLEKRQQDRPAAAQSV